MGKRAVLSTKDVAQALRRGSTSKEHAAEAAGCFRATLRRAVQRLTSPETTFRIVSFGEDRIAMASIPRLLQRLAAETPSLAEALAAAQRQAGQDPLKLVLSFDEATAGNVLAPDPQKKSCMIYAAVKELGTQSAALWVPVCVIGADTLKKQLQGSLGPVLRQFLHFAAEDKLEEGFLIQCSSSFFLRLKLAAVIDDGEAIRQALNCKGASGLKPCHVCKNVLMKNHPLAAAVAMHGYACDICSAEVEKWDLIADEELFEFCDLQHARKGQIPASLFAEEETLSGMVYNPDGLLQDDFARRQIPPSKWLFDFLHIYYTAGGCAAVEIAAILHEAERVLQQPADSLASLLEELPWQVPSHVLGLSGPRSRARLLHAARLPEKSYKGKATHVMQLLPLIPALLELLDDCDELAKPLASFEALQKIHLEINNLKRQEAISDTTRLQQLQREHHGLVLAAYGDGILKPKHHWRHHAATQLEAWGAYIDTSACEAKHQVYKNVANKNLDVWVCGPRWSKAVLDRMFCSCFQQLQLHFDRRAQICRGKEQKVQWGQQTLRTFKEVQWQGLHWKPGDFQLEPFPGMVARCCVSSADKPFLLLQEYIMEHKTRFSAVFRNTGRVRLLQAIGRSKLASWWLIEDNGLLRALR
ncbi:unnamed protein product [Symbiodinium necroappetens]|uniref:Uncharacterized protein n=1 Tax=Symbiodinium necroappetens TaxID=1628268 RepID=A0A813AAG7_9DINO|nr:unnamed protein product [Symbiodinium necroappetens]